MQTFKAYRTFEDQGIVASRFVDMQLDDLVVVPFDVPRALLAVGSGLRAADAVDGAAVGEGQHPRHGAPPPGVVPRGLSPDLHEGFLRDLFGLGRVPDDAQSGAVDGPRHLRVHRLEGLPVAACDESQQRGKAAGRLGGLFGVRSRCGSGARGERLAHLSPWSTGRKGLAGAARRRAAPARSVTSRASGRCR